MTFALTFHLCGCVAFVTTVFPDGNLCLDIIQDKWYVQGARWRRKSETLLTMLFFSAFFPR